jgi:uncharacterized membrane protein
VAAGNQTAYDVFVALHVASAVVGFGSVALSGAYGGHARHLDQETTAEELRRYFRARGRAELVLLAVPIFGASAVLVGPGGHEFGELWVDLGLGLWVLAAAMLVGIVRPGEAVLRRASQSAELADLADPRLPQAGRRLQWAAASCDLIFLVALVVMVIKPGS